MTKASNLSQKHLQQTFTQQHDQSDCGVACLLSLIQYYGGSNNLEKLRELKWHNQTRHYPFRLIPSRQ